jgi:hypothetical protein
VSALASPLQPWSRRNLAIRSRGSPDQGTAIGAAGGWSRKGCCLDDRTLMSFHDGLMKQSTGRPMLAEHHVAAIAVVGMALGIMALLFWFYW